MTRKEFNTISKKIKENSIKYTVAVLQDGTAIINIDSILVEKETLIFNYFTASRINDKITRVKESRKIHYTDIKKLR